MPGALMTAVRVGILSNPIGRFSAHRPALYTFHPQRPTRGTIPRPNTSAQPPPAGRIPASASHAPQRSRAGRRACPGRQRRRPYWDGRCGARPLRAGKDAQPTRRAGTPPPPTGGTPMLPVAGGTPTLPWRLPSPVPCSPFPAKPRRLPCPRSMRKAPQVGSTPDPSGVASRSRWDGVPTQVGSGARPSTGLDRRRQAWD